MPAPIILSNVSVPWPVIWAVFGGAAAVVVVLTTLVALATSPRHHARPTRHAAGQPGSAQLSQEATADRDALV